MKKILCLILSLAMLVSISAGVSLTASADTSGDFEYTVLDDGTAEITSYIGTATEVTVPSEIDGYEVSSLYAVFSYNDTVKSVSISDGISNIDYDTFAYCDSLEEISIPKSVTYIASTAIIYCPSLLSITVDSENTVYDSRNDCNVIIETATNILISGCINTVIPYGVVRIEGDAFNGCEGLKSITIPDSVISIGNFAFHKTGLVSVYIPSSVEIIEESALQNYYYPFYECADLEEIIVDSNNSNYASLDGVLFNKDLTKILHYPEGKKDSTYVLPQTVTVLENGDGTYYPFINNNYLTHIIFPETVTYIGRTTVSFGDVEDTKITILNPECEFPDGEGEQCFYGVDYIYGYAGSTAQEYAGDTFVAITEPVGEGIVSESTDNTYTIGSGTEISVYCTYELADFISVTVDYETVDLSNYTLAEGSTILTFKTEYLDTLSVGNHTVTLNYTNATTTMYLTIIGDSVEETPDADGNDSSADTNGDTDGTNTDSADTSTDAAGTADTNADSDGTSADETTTAAAGSGTNTGTTSPKTGASYAGIAAVIGAAALSGAALLFIKKRKE